MNTKLTSIARARSVAYKAVRAVLDEANAIEVRTPVLKQHPDLAPMPQFKTVNSLTGTEYLMRIAPEEALTSLVARGLQAVYEISNNFRVEGKEDSTHLCQFDAVEALFVKMSCLEAAMIMENVCRTIGVELFREYKNVQPWLSSQVEIPRVNVCKWIEEHLDIQADSLFSLKKMKQVSFMLGVPQRDSDELPDAMDEVIGAIARRYPGAVFLGCLPSYLGGPAARHPEYPQCVDRYEMYFEGIELGSVANQLRDPADWAERYRANVELKKKLRIEPNYVNIDLLGEITMIKSDFAGFGIGLDRAIMFACGAQSIHDVQI
jgi:lysyl-tRNA synthetase class II